MHFRPKADSSGISALVVDDNPIARRLHATLLEHLGHTGLMDSTHV
jgi:CheY-like chemotaxis protein